jgi:hypothetical protein
MTPPLFEVHVFTIAMVFSVVGFVAGAAIVASGVHWNVRRSWFDGIARPWALGVLVVVVAVAVVPHLYEELGFVGPALVVFGFGAHRLVDRRGGAPAHLASTLVVPVLTVHSALDGAALALIAQTGGGVGVAPLAPVLLSLPVALHRVPEGMLLAAALLPRAGARWTIAIAGVVGIAAVGGGLVGRAVFDAVGRPALQAIVAAGVGVLMSALLKRHRHHHTQVDR